MRTKTKLIAILFGSNVILMILCIILIVNMISCGKEVSSKPESKVTEVNTFKRTEMFKTADGNTEILDDSQYIVRPGYTYYLNKGNMKLFADITPSDEGKTLTVSGKEFHMDNEMSDAAINDVFTLDLSSGTYHNTQDNITINYDGLSATFSDTRNVALRFSGTLQLVQSIVTEGSDSPSSAPVGLVPSDIVSVNIATQAPEGTPDLDKLTSSALVGDLITDEYSDSATSSMKGEEFNSILNPANERKQYVITAKFIESTSNSGTKYQEVNTGVYFYAFGQTYPYNSSICNVVTITGTYRGNEKHFNGLQMDDTYPCFVINNIRKVNKSELN